MYVGTHWNKVVCVQIEIREQEIEKKAGERREREITNENMDCRNRKMKQQKEK